MDLIYADVINNTIVDKGIIANYTLDLSFGENENDFVLKCPESVTRLYPDMVVYIDGTEYGGVIDSVAIDTETRMFTYSGRTWHGILENKTVYPYKNSDHMVLTGEANYVIGILLERLSLVPSSRNELYVQPQGAFLTASPEDSGIYIDGYVVSNGTGVYESGYSLLRNMLYQYKAKPIIINGVVKAVNYNDYTIGNAWLYDSQQFRAQRNYNSVNHIHCLGAGELSKRYTIDLYLNESGQVLPYGHDERIYDSDYYTDISALAGSSDPEEIADLQIIVNGMITGVNEICEIYDYPNAQTVFHYVLQTASPFDWASEISPGKYGFEQYYVIDTEKTDDNEAQYKGVPKPSLDVRYDLLTSKPSDWDTNYTAYYEPTPTGYENVERGEYTLLTSQPENWITSYDNYFYKDGSSYKNVKTFIEYRYLTSKPDAWDTQYMLYFMPNGTGISGVEQPQTYSLYEGGQPNDWATSYSNYYYNDGLGNYSQVPGVSYPKYTALYDKPGDFAVNWLNYYVYYKSSYYRIEDVWDELTGISSPSGYSGDIPIYSKSAPPPAPSLPGDNTWKYLTITKGLTVYEKSSYKVAPNFSTYHPLYTKNAKTVAAPTWTPSTYCYKYEGAPTWQANTYYKYSDIPTWVRDSYYKAVEYQPIPIWQSGVYYTQIADHYQSLIEGALSKLEELKGKSELSINISEGGTEYDINDVVAASDEITGLGANAKVTQKILKIERGIPTVSYKVGNV